MRVKEFFILFFFAISTCLSYIFKVFCIQSSFIFGGRRFNKEVKHSLFYINSVFKSLQDPRLRVFFVRRYIPSCMYGGRDDFWNFRVGNKIFGIKVGGGTKVRTSKF